MRLASLAVPLLGTIAIAPGMATAADAVQGLLTTQGVTGRTAAPHGWVEEKVYLGQLDAGFGAGAETAAKPPGWFSISGRFREGGFPAGTYALFTLCYDAGLAFSVKPDVEVPPGTATLDKVKLETPAHYSVMYATSHDEWGEKPWLWGDDFYQTFVATTPHITRVATKLAGKSGDHFHLTLNYAIYETNDGPPSSWKRISPVRSRFLSGGTDPIIHVFWVPYRSSEIALTTGRTYAVRFWRDPVSQSQTFAIVARTDRGDGYAAGRLYAGEKPHDELDAYACVTGGAAGTICNHAPTGDMDLKQLIGSAVRFGQTFRATGVGVAAVDVIYATGETRPASLPIAFQVYDKPGGRPIGPARTCYGLPRAFQARAAAFWKRGDVPLTPGRTYYLEWSTPRPCNTWQLNEDLPGEAYREGRARPEADLAMSIVEYAPLSSSR